MYYNSFIFFFPSSPLMSLNLYFKGSRHGAAGLYLQILTSVLRRIGTIGSIRPPRRRKTRERARGKKIRRRGVFGERKKKKIIKCSKISHTRFTVRAPASLIGFLNKAVHSTPGIN